MAIRADSKAREDTKIIKTKVDIKTNRLEDLKVGERGEACMGTKVVRMAKAALTAERKGIFLRTAPFQKCATIVAVPSTLDMLVRRRGRAKEKLGCTILNRVPPMEDRSHSSNSGQTNHSNSNGQNRRSSSGQSSNHSKKNTDQCPSTAWKWSGSVK